MSISSFVIHCHPDNITGLSDNLSVMAGIETHAITDEGRFVVTLDQPDDRKAADTFSQLQNLDEVLNVSLVYNYIEQSPVDKEQLQ